MHVSHVCDNCHQLGRCRCGDGGQLGAHGRHAGDAGRRKARQQLPRRHQTGERGRLQHAPATRRIGRLHEQSTGACGRKAHAAMKLRMSRLADAESSARTCGPSSRLEVEEISPPTAGDQLLILRMIVAVAGAAAIALKALSVLLFVSSEWPTLVTTCGSRVSSGCAATQQRGGAVVPRAGSARWPLQPASCGRAAHSCQWKRHEVRSQDTEARAAPDANCCGQDRADHRVMLYCSHFWYGRRRDRL